MSTNTVSPLVTRFEMWEQYTHYPIPTTPMQRLIQDFKSVIDVKYHYTYYYSLVHSFTPVSHLLRGVWPWKLFTSFPEIAFRHKIPENTEIQLFSLFFRNLNNTKKLFSLQITHNNSKTTPVGMHWYAWTNTTPVFKCYFSLWKQKLYFSQEHVWP